MIELVWVDRAGWWELHHPECLITIEKRPYYCDRGNYLAKLFQSADLALQMDDADAWPRYYFDLDRAKLECEAWVRKRFRVEHT